MPGVARGKVDDVFNLAYNSTIESSNLSVDSQPSSQAQSRSWANFMHMAEGIVMSHEIIDESAHTNFTIIPNIIHQKWLNLAAFRLYIWFKKVAGETGSCWQSLDTICSGTGMSKPTITKGRQELKEADLISVKRTRMENGSEKIIVKITDVWNENREVLDMSETKTSPTESPDKGKRNFNARCNNSGSADKRKLDLIRLKAKKKEETLSSEKTNSRKNKLPTSFDHRAAAELRKVVSSHIKVNKNADMKRWADQFRLLRERDGVTIDEIKNAIKWYKHHIGEEYIPEAYSADTFREKYNNNQIPAAMKRTAEEGPGSNGSVDARDIFNELQIMGCSLDYDQEDIDDATMSLGAAAGTFTMKDMPE